MLEIKAVRRYGDMEKDCGEALRKIEDKEYWEELKQEEYEDILAYGICFFQKECVVEI